jgi:lipoyl-dependent peroxiredoxin
MKATGLSTWKGSWKKGEGTISTQSETFKNKSYSFASRFEGTSGAIPEELLAAAHAACYNQALANAADHKNLTAENIHTILDVDLGFDDLGRPEIKGLHFTVQASIPGISEELFLEIVNQARLGCAISKALKIDSTITATLVG